MPPNFSNGGDGVSVPKYSTFNTFLWYFFQTLTVSSMLLMVLSIYYYAFASSTNNNNIQVICVIISVAFSIISPSFIIPRLPTLAAMAIPILEHNKNIIISPIFEILNISVWMVCGYVYPFAVHLSCYCFMVGVGLLKLYSDGGPSSLKWMRVIGANAVGPCVLVFNHEMEHGTGRWVDSGAGWALLGLIVVTILAYYLPPLVEPEKKKVMNVAEEAPTPGGQEKYIHLRQCSGIQVFRHQCWFLGAISVSVSLFSLVLCM